MIESRGKTDGGYNLLNRWLNMRPKREKKIDITDLAILIEIERNSPYSYPGRPLRDKFSDVATATFYRKLDFMQNLNYIKKSKDTNNTIGYVLKEPGKNTLKIIHESIDKYID
ncbi:MAG: hypothetical protein INQ03_16265 [Candidatus Heimdallarchaeota archaeon]|nr:hypothetical protein [Candidatus Heimdallarchaeota archaeon]